MDKYVMALCLPENSEEIDAKKVTQMIKNSFTKYGKDIKDVIILDFLNIAEDVRNKMLENSLIDNFVLSAETIEHEVGKDTVVKAIKSENESERGTQFLGVYDGKNEENTQKTCELIDKIRDLVESGQIQATILDQNMSEQAFELNVQSMHDSRMKTRRMIKLKDKEIYDLVKNINETLNEKDEYTSKHVRSTCMIADAIARRYGLPEEEIEIMGIGALIHDYGKKDVRDEVLKKPSRLTDNEFKEMQQHVVLGEMKLLNYDLGEYERAKYIMAQHHEKYDGTGYPRGLKGEEIERGARILAVADSIQAMLGRAYSEGRTVDQIQEQLQKCAGTQFDPEFADIASYILKHEPELMGISYDEKGKIEYNVKTIEELTAEVEGNRDTEGFLGKLKDGVKEASEIENLKEENDINSKNKDKIGPSL